VAVFPVEPFDLVIFGGTGDLALRKLLPALLQRFLAGQMPGTSRVIGVARDAMSADEYRTRVRPALSQGHGGETVSEGDIERFLALLDYRRLDAARDEGWVELAEHLLRADGKRVRVFYLATSPELFAALCAHLKRYGLADADERVVIEKPIGRDLATARAINDAVGAAFPERRIFRIDHYLGKETVQNLVALRFANALFEPVWMSQHVDHVQITVAENIGVERRGPYYDKAGALRDMVQNHLLQLLCLVAMEPPAALDADAIRDEKLKVLRALKPIAAHNAEQLKVSQEQLARVIAKPSQAKPSEANASNKPSQAKPSQANASQQNPRPRISPPPPRPTATPMRKPAPAPGDPRR
jgi:glucose-6-phosphate 1-dehydrogenase